MPDGTPILQDSPLAEEFEFYNREKAKLLETAVGKFALIKDQQLAGTYDTDQDAYKVGLEKFGNVPFLIIQVLPDDQQQQKWIPAISLGLLHARL